VRAQPEPPRPEPRPAAAPEPLPAPGPAFAGLILAAGAGTRFGGGKVRALLAGRPLVAHVLAAAREAGLERLVLVLGRDVAEVRAALLAADPAALSGVLLAVNPSPERGLATSVRLGLAAATAAPAPGGVVALLGDQPRVRPAVIGALTAAARQAPADALAVVPVYEGGGAPNPVLLLPAGWAAAESLAGDRGFGPLLAAAAERVLRVPVGGSNPDVDTRADLAALEEGRA
jgi:CTP:molybdopterin cytidylyltransferase MocA